MRKNRVLALVVASLVSTASFAGAQAPGVMEKGGRHAMGRGMEGRREGARGEMLRGLKLSDAEKTKIKEIRSRYAAEGKAQRESMKPAMQEARALRQKGDTAGLRALRDRNKASRDQMQALALRQQADIRGALSAENQKQFDMNLQERASRRAEWSKDGRNGRRGEHPRNHARAGR
ncbi:MAG: Spy/CpxP family protein refolding chaperone [Gemmatimonadaceae bacterium]